MKENLKENWNCYLDMWKNFKDFSGRTNRRDYWIAIIINAIVISLVASIATSTGIDMLNGLYSLLAFVPTTAIIVRRLNDIGKSWKWFFIGFIPVIGWIWIIILMCKKSV